MRIHLKTTKGRTEIATEIDSDFESEYDWQEFMLGVFDFLIAAGVELPEEIADALDEWND
jgi:hypothetical protein